MSTQTSTERCDLCGGTFSRTAMTRHLSNCSRPKPSAASSAVSSHSTGKSFHLVVEGREARVYWMHLAAPVEAHLSKIDAFLRRAWLECCGHLSAFSIGGKRYASGPMPEMEERGMHVALHRVLDVGTRFSYEYDYGSTTALTLKVVALREEGTRRGAVQLLARNDAPHVTCEECGSGKPATQICTECAWDGRGWLCEECAAAHKCGPDMLLPVVNSPRAGTCGYAG